MTVVDNQLERPLADIHEFNKEEGIFEFLDMVFQERIDA